MQGFVSWASRGMILGLLAALSGCSADVESALDAEGEAEVQALHRRPEVSRVPLSTGVTLEYLEQGRRHGKPVIFIHGYTDSHHSFDLNLPLLSRRYHVFAIDLRGHGDSSKPACCYEQSDFAEDVVAFMDAIGLERASLVGHSMGSFIAQRVALDFPSRVEKLVLIGSAPTVAGNPVAIEFKSAVDTLVDPIDPQFVREFQASTFFRPIPPAFLDLAVSESLKVPASIWQQALDGLLVEDHTSRLPSLGASTLILYGDQDIFFSASEAAALDALIPDSRLVVYPQTGHGTHVELPRRTVRDLERFLR